MTTLDRIGCAIAKPRYALAIAGDRENAGRAGTDLIAAIALFLVATQVSWLVSAVWLGVAVDPMLGFRATTHILTRVLTPDLGALMIAATAIWLAGGPRRELGRAFDLACVAVIPGVVVHLIAQVAIDAARVVPPDAVRWVIEAIAVGWMLALVALAVAASRGAPTATYHVAVSSGRRAGIVVAVVAGVGSVFQVAWLVRNIDQVRPVTEGVAAPPLQLQRIGPSGPEGAPVSITPGRPTVVDFWATWCSPCLKQLPKLNAFARRHPEVDVFAINLDDAAAARALFDAAGYTLPLLADDGVASQRYGVTSIPHTVVIDREGRIRAVARGGSKGGQSWVDLEAEIGAAATRSAR